MSFLNNLNWRYATKEFNTKKIVSKENLDKILAAARMAPTSHGLQSWHAYVITDNKIKNKIQVKSFLQKQVSSCSYLIIFCARKDKEDMSKRIDEYIKLSTKGNKIKKLKMQPLRLMMKGFIKTKSNEEHLCWASKQSYIALSFAMAACTELKIDSCPMEGFDKQAVDKILNLPSHLESSVMLPIGYRKEDPKRSKFRFPNDDLFTHL